MVYILLNEGKFEFIPFEKRCAQTTMLSSLRKTGNPLIPFNRDLSVIDDNNFSWSNDVNIKVNMAFKDELLEPQSFSVLRARCHHPSFLFICTVTPRILLPSVGQTKC